MRALLSKRGQEMSISTLVLIVLAIIVLVLIVIGFTGGWSNLWDRITNLGGSKENVQLIIQSCQIACSSNSQYDYCTRLRDVNFGSKEAALIVAISEDTDGKIKATCGALAEKRVGDLRCETYPASMTGCGVSRDTLRDDKDVAPPTKPTCEQSQGQGEFVPIVPPLTGCPMGRTQVANDAIANPRNGYACCLKQ